MTDRRRLTVSIPVADWDNLEAEALAQGLKIGTLAARVIIDHVNPSTRVQAVRDTRIPTPAEWTAVSAWLNAMGITGPMLKAKGCRTKTEALAWARDNGYTS